MKTLANCSPRELVKYGVEIADVLSQYSTYIQENKDKLTVIDIIKYVISDDNIEDTFRLCGALCCMSAEEFADYESTGDEDIILTALEVLTSKRVTSFFPQSSSIKRRSKKSS